LSILQSEIAKMTLRIREQNVALKKEKENLADSLADYAKPSQFDQLVVQFSDNEPL
jgi:hypothetical protein